MPYTNIYCCLLVWLTLLTHAIHSAFDFSVRSFFRFSHPSSPVYFFNQSQKVGLSLNYLFCLALSFQFLYYLPASRISVLEALNKFLFTLPHFLLSYHVHRLLLCFSLNYFYLFLTFTSLTLPLCLQILFPHFFIAKICLFAKLCNGQSSLKD